MTATVTETFESAESGGSTLTFTGQSTELRRIFIVTFKTADLEAGRATDVNAFRLVNIPLGSAHPEIAYAFLERYEVAPIKSGAGARKVTLVYKTDTVVLPPDDPDGGNQSFTLSGTAKPKNIYRREFEVPDAGAEKLTDCGGNAFDVQGEPTTFVDVQPEVNVTLSVIVDVTIPGNYLSSSLTLVGTRNKATFFGAAPGYLLFVGTSSSKVSGVGPQSVFEVTHRFIYDNEAHLVQVPKSTDLRASGVQLGKDVNNATYANNAFEVTLRQPFPVLGDFDGLGINIGGA